MLIFMHSNFLAVLKRADSAWNVLKCILLSFSPLCLTPPRMFKPHICNPHILNPPAASDTSTISG